MAELMHEGSGWVEPSRRARTVLVIDRDGCAIRRRLSNVAVLHVADANCCNSIFILLHTLNIPKYVGRKAISLLRLISQQPFGIRQRPTQILLFLLRAAKLDL